MKPVERTIIRNSDMQRSKAVPQEYKEHCQNVLLLVEEITLCVQFVCQMTIYEYSTDYKVHKYSDVSIICFIENLINNNNTINISTGRNNRRWTTTASS